MGHQNNLKIISMTPVRQSCNYSAYDQSAYPIQGHAVHARVVCTTGSLGSVFPGTWTWSTTTITTTKGKKYKKLVASYDPNPGTRAR